MSDATDSKAEVRAWLLILLAELETMTAVEGSRTEDSSGSHITLDLQFKA